MEASHLKAIAAATDQASLESAYMGGHVWCKQGGGGAEALVRLKAAYAARASLLAQLPLSDGLKDVVRRGTEMLKERLERDDAPDQLVLRAVEVGARALGMGARTENVPVQVNLAVHLEELGANLVRLLRKKRGEAIEHDENTVQG